MKTVLLRISCGISKLSMYCLNNSDVLLEQQNSETESFGELDHVLYFHSSCPSLSFFSVLFTSCTKQWVLIFGLFPRKETSVRISWDVVQGTGPIVEPSAPSLTQFFRSNQLALRNEHQGENQLASWGGAVRMCQVREKDVCIS